MKFSTLLLVALVVCLVASAAARPSHHHKKPHHGSVKPHPDDALRHAMIAKVNSMNSSWTAGFNRRFAGQPITAIKRQLGVRDVNPPVWKRPPIKVHTGFDIAALPTSFDSRQQWPNCPTIKEIRDQSDCGSCWAFGAVEAASDRICIDTQGAKNAHLSAEDMVGCCSACGFGCDGGDPASAWNYLTTTGAVTGGNYGDESWCSAYSLPNCEHHNNHTTYPPCGPSEYPTPACPTACDSQSTYGTPFAQDKHIFATSYSVPADPVQIQQEILTSGPIEVAFTVYADFEQYSSGVYQHVSGDELGGHAVKILGWGVDSASNLPYWLVANSWNNDWGENGYFRILRGADECGIEDYGVAGKFQ
jgi:cathepsin B